MGNKLYSINLCGYVIATTDIHPTYQQDEATKQIFMVFPDCNAVSLATAEYRYGEPTVDLNKFLMAVRNVRNNILALKSGCDTE